MFKGSDVQRFVWVGIVLILLVFAWGAGRGMTGREAYYRGVWETCVMQSMVNDQTTLFDLVVCDEMVKHAREDGWYETVLELE